MIELRNGATTLDRRLDRIRQFDDRSRAFAIRDLLPSQAPRSYTWRGYTLLDQGQEGACVGFGWAHELIARPVVVLGVTDNSALSIYHLARTLDEFPGEDYSGTSVLAGAKAVTKLGKLLEYRWGFSFSDLVQTLGYHGPVVLGVNWHQDMMDTDHNGQIHPTGPVIGGHCVLVDSVSVKARTVSGPNSWGTSWGVNGRWTMPFDEMEQLLKDDGEQCVPVRRHL